MCHSCLWLSSDTTPPAARIPTVLLLLATRGAVAGVAAAQCQPIDCAMVWPPQEAAYNMGRAAHQLGLLHLAVPLYERALRCAAHSVSSETPSIDVVNAKQ